MLPSGLDRAVFDLSFLETKWVPVRLSMRAGLIVVACLLITRCTCT